MASRRRFICELQRINLIKEYVSCIKKITNSGYDVSICQEHHGVFSKSDDDNDQVSDTIFVLMEKETIVEGFRHGNMMKIKYFMK